MASADTFSSFRDASTDFTDAVAKLLRNAAEYADLERVGSADRPHYLRGQAAVDEAWKKSFELGVVSIELAHKTIAFFSEPDTTSAKLAIQPRFQSVALAIEATRTKCAELQPVVDAAWQARRSLLLSRENTSNYGFVHRSMNAIDEYFGPIEDGKVPSLESRATELAELWNSFKLKPTEIEITASIIPEIVTLNQRHIVRVCMYGLPLKPRYESASSATLDSPLVEQILGDCLLGREPYVRILAGYSTQSNMWRSDALTRLFSEDIINSLSSLQSHEFSDWPEEASLSLTELLRLFTEAFASLFCAFASTWAIEQPVHRINTLDIFPLDRDSFATLQTVPVHLERVRGAATDAQVRVDTIILILKQLLQKRVFVGCNASTDINDDPKCAECELTDLLTYSEEVLSNNTRLFAWEKTVSQRQSDEKENNTLIKDFHGIVTCERPYAPSLHPQHFVDPDPQLSTISQISLGSHVNPAFDLENSQLFWSQVLTITTHLRQYLPLKDLKFKSGHSASQAPPKLLHRWRPCSCKEQSKFAAESKKAKGLSQIAPPHTSGPFSRKVPPPAASTQGTGSAQKRGGTSSLQGDWTF